MNVFRDYDAGNCCDAMFLPIRDARPQGAGTLDRIPDAGLRWRRHAAERTLLAMGITADVHGHGKGGAESLPADVVPRSLEGAAPGLKPPVVALDVFSV